MTKAGIAKLHKQFWHLQEEPLFKRLSSVVPEAKHSVLRRMCKEVCDECPICRSHTRPGLKPKVGGLWAREPNHIVAADCIFVKVGKDGKPIPGPDFAKYPKTDIKTHCVMHLVDLFSGFSMAHLCAGSDPSGDDTLAALRRWADIFGKMPITFFTDQGGEFTNAKLNAFFHEADTEHLFAGPQAPYSNGVNERHNAILKVWLGKLLADHGDKLSF